YWFLDRLHNPALVQIRVVHEFERGHQGAAGNAGTGDDPGDLLLGVFRRPFGDGRVHGLPILETGGAVDHARIVEQVLAADRLHQAAPMLLVAPRGKDVAQVVESPRCALVEAAGRGAVYAVAAARQLVLAGGLAAHRRAAIVQHRIAHGDLDVLAAAGCHALVQRGEDAHGAKHAGAGIADGRTRPDRRLVGVAVHPHGAAHRLGDHVEGEIVRVLALRR